MKRILLISGFIALVLGAEIETERMTYKRFKTLKPMEIYGKEGNYMLCFSCKICKKKKFQRMYIRCHLGRKKK